MLHRWQQTCQVNFHCLRQSKLHKVYIVVTGAPLNFCLAETIAEQYFLLISFMKLAPNRGLYLQSGW